MVAMAAIVVIREKKQGFDEMDSKTSVLNTMRDGLRDHSVIMTATTTTPPFCRALLSFKSIEILVRLLSDG